MLAAHASMPAVFSFTDIIVTVIGLVIWLVTVSDVIVPLGASATWLVAWLSAALGISSSHILYALVWFFPAHFHGAFEGAFFGATAVDIFAILVAVAKGLQQVSVVVWVLQATGSNVTLAVTELAGLMSVTKCVVAVALLSTGQCLNAAIYRAIGRDGVYYGFKLGRPVPWSTAFPFNSGFRHPQYVGGMLSQLGVLVPLATTKTMEAGLLPLVGFWTALYGITSWMEASGDNDVKAD